MTRPLRLLHVIGGLGVGGAETWLMAMLRYWREQEIGEMDFLLTGGVPDRFDEEALQLGAKLYYLPYGRAHLPRFMPAYRALLRNGNYDAIHDHSDYASGWRLAMGMGVLPAVRVAHVHNPWLHISANYAVSPRRRFAAAGGKALVKALATDVCGTSAEILRQYGFIPGSSSPRVDVVHCGVSMDRFSIPRVSARERILAEFGWPREARIVLFAGRLDRALELNHPQNHKNSWLALNIAREAAMLDPSLHLIMAGDGPTRAALIEQVAKWGMEDKFALPGIRDNVPELMAAADALLFPSVEEGLGMVAVEAQACALPVLASDAVPSEAIVIPELYRAISLEASLAQWANVLLELARQPRLDAGSCRSRVALSDFSIVNSSRKLERIYRSDHRN
jgi:glycosyltransferase involved in cell wall biosynthesis